MEVQFGDQGLVCHANECGLLLWTEGNCQRASSRAVICSDLLRE